MARTSKAALTGNIFEYSVGEETISAELSALFPTFEEFSASAKECVFFALKTAARNATAGVLETNLAEAAENVKTRLGEWAQGIWKAARKGGIAAEPRQSVLARAIALATGKSIAEAAEMVSAAVSEAIEELNLDPEEDGYQASARKVAASVRKDLRAMVAKSYAIIQLQDKQAALATGLEDTIIQA